MTCKERLLLPASCPLTPLPPLRPASRARRPLPPLCYAPSPFFLGFSLYISSGTRLLSLHLIWNPFIYVLRFFVWLSSSFFFLSTLLNCSESSLYLLFYFMVVCESLYLPHPPPPLVPSGLSFFFICCSFVCSARSKRVLKFHVLVTTYDDVISDAEMLAQVPW